MKLGKELLYLSDADIRALDIAPGEVVTAIERMFAAKADGSAVMKPKLGLHAPSGTVFLGSAGVLSEPAVAGIKWVGVADSGDSTLPHIAGTILLSDNATGMPLAVMDARWITGWRTAAITAVAAKHLARADSATIAFVACGLQARTNLACLRTLFPLQRVKAVSRRLPSAEALAREVRESGLEAEAFDDPRAALDGADIVVTSTPVVPRTEPFLDAAWLASGSFTAMVDLGISWVSESLRGLDLVVTDDQSQAESEQLAYPEPYAGEVADLVAGSVTGRRDMSARTGLVFAGIGLADVAAAALVHERALARGAGRTLET